MSDCGLRPSIILTGQHPDLDPAEHGLDGLPSVALKRRGRAAPHRHVEAVFEGTVRALERRPDLLVVQGDTSSALGATLAAIAVGVPVAHVEAGLRTHDPAQPWPEEEYRCRIDSCAELLFAPTQLAAENLRNENVRGAIHVTGNSGIDALLRVQASLPPTGLRERGAFRLLVTCHRRENWGSGLCRVAAALIELARDKETEIDVVLHPNRELSSTIRRLLASVENIGLLPPCNHPNLIQRMRECDLLLSDSGGIQEEAPALGVPLLVLRDKTERPEALQTGNMLLVGCRTDEIVGAVRRLRDDPAALAAMARPCFPYGDGRASERIATIVGNWVAEQLQPRQRAV